MQNEVVKMTQEKSDIEVDLGSCMMQFAEASEERADLKMDSDEVNQKVNQGLAKVVQKKSDLVEYENETLQLEEDIYELSIGNYGRMSTREKLIEVLPEIFYQVKQEKKLNSGRANQ